MLPRDVAWPRPRWRWVAVLALTSACATGADDPPTPPVVVVGDATSDDPPGDTDAATSTGTAGDGASGQGDGTSGLDSTGGPVTSDSSGGPPPVCPPEPDDVPCEVCGKEACCSEYLVCRDDAQCSCALDCYLGGTEVGDCFVMCGASSAALALFNCAAPACEGICE